MPAKQLLPLNTPFDGRYARHRRVRMRILDNSSVIQGYAAIKKLHMRMRHLSVIAL